KRRHPLHAARYGAREHRMLSQSRLVLAGPDPASVRDDPEATEVFRDLCSAYRGLEPTLQADVVPLALPIGSLQEDALVVNALRRGATLVGQNSRREGLGLTVTEAMWKGCAVLAGPACGLRQQIRHGIDGYLLKSAEDPEEISDALTLLLSTPHTREAYG